MEAYPFGPEGAGNPEPLLPGIHIVYAFAVDAQAATLSSRYNSVTLLGDVTAMVFLVTERSRIHLPVVSNLE